jgi:hypothetical protein
VRCYELKVSLAVASILLCAVLPAHGHAVLLSASPALHEVVRGPNVTVKLKFNARIDAKRSRVTLLAPDGEQRVLSFTKTSSSESLDSEANGLTVGSYVLRWQVLASDGHISRGEVPFVVQ